MVRVRVAVKAAVVLQYLDGIEATHASERILERRGIPLDHTHAHASCELPCDPMAFSRAKPS
jgi:hypothetical protein